VGDKEVSSKLKIMHELKEEIRKVFEQSDNWLTGLLKLGIWLATANKFPPHFERREGILEVQEPLFNQLSA
jgi:hypothetical protein